jgi:redox-regulated HSP33 family molecular chaperone
MREITAGPKLATGKAQQSAQIVCQINRREERSLKLITKFTYFAVVLTASMVFRATYALNLTTSGAADTVGANCVAQGSSRGVHRIQDFDHRGLLVNIDNLIIPVRTTECERQSARIF